MVDVVGLHGGEVFGRAAREAVVGAEVLVGADRHLAAVAAATAEPAPRRTPRSGRPPGPLESPEPPGRASGSWWPAPWPPCSTRWPSGPPPGGGSASCPRAIPASSASSGSWPNDSVPSSSPSTPHPRRWPWPPPGWASPGTTPWSSRPTAAPLADAVAETVRHPKAAVLTSPSAPPEALGRALRQAGAPASARWRSAPIWAKPVSGSSAPISAAWPPAASPDCRWSCSGAVRTHPTRPAGRRCHGAARRRSSTTGRG